MSKKITFALASLFGCFGWSCTNVELCTADPITGECLSAPMTREDNMVSVQGTACTVDPSWVLFPYKILFVIDQSTSNRDTDPQDKRASAVKAIIDQYIENRAVSYGVIGFSKEGLAMTPEFTRDYTMLSQIVGPNGDLTNEIAWTDYLAALRTVTKFIDDDAQRVPAGEIARTRYDIQFLSDGAPWVGAEGIDPNDRGADGCETLEAVQAITQGVMDLQAKYGFYSIHVNTTRLVGGTIDPRYACTLDTQAYLRPMAEIGKGSYRELTADNLDFEIEFTELSRPYEERQFFLVNENRVVVDNQLWPDSDGDGVRDIDEGVAPREKWVDSNHDGCSDKVDQLLNSEVICGDSCSMVMLDNNPDSLLDTDGDLLPDCAEQSLGTQAVSSDSDLDGFTDLLELKFGTNPIQNTTLTHDTDRDGVVDADEIILGTNPFSPEDSTFRYLYQPVIEVASETEFVRCFDFKIDNVQLVHTVATDSKAEGVNDLCVYLVQVSSDDPNAIPTVTRACKPARYLPDQDYKDPVNGRLTFSPKDFQPYVNCEE